MKTLLGLIIFFSFIFVIGTAGYWMDNYPIESLYVAIGSLIMTFVVCILFENYDC